MVREAPPAVGGGALIAWENVTVRFRGRPAVEAVSLHVPAGQRVALVGPNGAGKSTLLRTLVGLVPYAGRVTVAGLDPRTQPVAVRRRIGYVPQILSFPPHLTAAEVVTLCQELRGVSPDPDPVLEEAGLRLQRGKPVRELSGGMSRRLGVALARLGDPPVLVLDEPASYLDQEGQRWLVDWLRSTRNKTVLLASHGLRGLDGIVDRVVLLESGRVAADVATHQLLAAHWLEVVVPPPVPEGLPQGVRVLASRNGAVHLRVPDSRLLEVLGALRGRPVRVHEPPLEEVLQEVLG